jgi:hypothetical protein
VNNPFRLPEKAPIALPSRHLGHHTSDAYCWEDWHRDMKAKYPVRYFISRTIPRVLRRLYARRPRIFYWIRAHTYNRYHILDMRNDAWPYKWGWCDRSELMLFACFNLLKAFVEEEAPNIGHAKTPEEFWPDHDWQPGEKETIAAHVETEREIRRLYTWWTIGRRNDHDSWEADSNRPGLTDEDYRRLNQEHEFIMARDEEMLQRLMKVRGSLWT